MRRGVEGLRGGGFHEHTPCKLMRLTIYSHMTLTHLTREAPMMPEEMLTDRLNQLIQEALREVVAGDVPADAPIMRALASAASVLAARDPVGAHGGALSPAAALASQAANREAMLNHALAVAASMTQQRLTFAQ